MATKSTPTTKPTDAPDIDEPTAAEVHEAELDAQELLADMPKLRSPERLRLRHKNRVMALGVRYLDRLKKLGVKADKDGNTKVSTDQLLTMLDLAAELDEFAESIAEDPDEYERWAEANSGSPEVFFAILDRYQVALGESTGSAS